MSTLLEDDSWLGSDEERLFATQQIEELLVMTCGCGELVKSVRTSNGRIEYLINDTWEDAGLIPNSIATPSAPDLTAFTDQPCVMASWVRDELEDYVSSMLDLMDTGGDVVTSLGSILPLLAPWGVAVNAVINWLSAGFDFGLSAIQAQLTTTFYDQAQCLLYCDLGATPELTEEIFNDWADNIHTEVNNLASEFVRAMLIASGYNYWKYVAYRSQFTGTEPTCEFCDCPDMWSYSYYDGDGDSDQFTYSMLTSGTPYYNATYDRYEGDGNVGNSFNVGGRLYVTSANYTSVSGTVEWNKTRDPNLYDNVYRLYIDGVLRDNKTWKPTGANTYEFSWTGDLSGVLEINGAARNNSDSDGSYWRITQITLSGKGTDPFV